LQALYLFKTKVTDMGLKELAGLQNLQILFLGGTRVTDEGMAELQKILQKSRISR
jgi:hypothetical protein